MVHKEGVIIAAFKPSNDFKIAIACLGTWVRSDMLCCLLKKCNALIAVQFSYLQELLSIRVFHICNFSTKRIVHTLTCPSGAYTKQIQKLFHLG